MHSSSGMSWVKEGFKACSPSTMATSPLESLYSCSGPSARPSWKLYLGTVNSPEPITSLKHCRMRPSSRAATDSKSKLPSARRGVLSRPR